MFFICFCTDLKSRFLTLTLTRFAVVGCLYALRWLDNDSLLDYLLLWVFVILNDFQGQLYFSLFVVMHRGKTEAKGIDVY